MMLISNIFTTPMACGLLL